MRKFKLGILFFLLLTSCKEEKILDTDLLTGSYVVKDNKVYYQMQAIYNADKDSFKILNFNYAKDKNNVYFGITAIQNADPESFEVIDSETAKDKKYVYHNENIIAGADPKTFKCIKCDGYKFFRDKEYIYSMDGMVLDIDKNSYKISGNYIMDSTNAYNENRKIDGVDMYSFEIISDMYSKDKNYVYRRNRYIKGADPESFRLLQDESAQNNNIYAVDSDDVFYDGNIIKEADPETFKLLGNVFALDKGNVYASGVIIDIDKYNYKIWKNGLYIKDHKKVFWDTNQVIGADPETFEELGSENIAKDKNNIYNREKAVKKFSPKKLSYIDGAYYIYDNKIINLAGRSFFTNFENLVTEIDPKTCVYIGEGYMKDKDYVYFNGLRLDGLKPDNINKPEDVPKE